MSNNRTMLSRSALMLAISTALGLLPLCAHARSTDQPLPPAGAQEAPATAASTAVPAVTSPSAPAHKNAKLLGAVAVHGRFISNAGESAMKLNVPVRDTPYSISSYSQSFMNAIEVHKVSDLYSYMTGIQSAGVTGYDITFRGFTAGANDQNTILIDGLPGLATRFGSPVTIGISRIEVVRGPASVANGQEQPGGFIDLITKKPEDQPFYEFSASGAGYAGHGIDAGSKLGGDFGADLTGPLDKSGRFLYRVIVDDSNRDGFRTDTYNRSIYFAPSVTWRINSRTTATLQYVYQHLHYSYDTYLVAPASNIDLVAPITTRYQEPGDHYQEYGNVVTFFLTHHLVNGMTWHFHARSVWHTDTAVGHDVVAILPNLLQVSRRARGQINKRQYDYADTSLDMPFSTGSITHKSVVGLTAGRDSYDFNRTQFYNAPTSGPNSLDISIYNPIYGLGPALSQLPAATSIKSLSNRYSNTISYGGYFIDMMKLSQHWKASFGVRYQHDYQDIQERRIPNVPSSNKSTSDLLPTAGLVYQPNRDWSWYASYSTSYVPPPANAVDTSGVNSFAPIYANQVEVGSKVSFLDHRAFATLALYRINERNTLGHFACATYGTCYEQFGKARSQGLEFEINARPLPHWQVIAGYAYTDAKVTASTNAFQVGTTLPEVPKNSAHVWTRYDFSGGALRGLGLGLGVIYDGNRQGFTPTKAGAPVLQLPSFTRVDTALYYNWSRYSLTFGVQNIFDKTYYVSSGFTGDLALVPGAPRMYTLTLRAYFE